jgi:hypothetical protein
MAVGDTVSGLFTTLNVFHYFQPAAGVEIMITWCGGRGTQTYSGLSNGTTNAYSATADNADYNSGSNSKLPINNTNYLSCHANATVPCYSGIQIK